MRYHALAADYDGTLAHHGVIDEPTWAALRKLKASGRLLVMVTGRELDELLALLPAPELFDRIVAENGALVYTPATRAVKVIAPGPPAAFVAELHKRGVERISVGRVIVATWEPYQDTALEVIHDQGLELQVIFNKGAVMILPSGINKATGLATALADLGLSAHNVVGIGDAENDHALLASCECAAVVANGLPSLKEVADVVTQGDHGRGVAELIDQLVADDLADRASRLKRHRIVIGRAGTREIAIDPYETCAMICGTSGSGKSTLTTAILERLSAEHYQVAILDPEGDYGSLGLAIGLGAPGRTPLIEEILDVLEDPTQSVAVNLLGLAVDDRPGFCAQLLPRLAALRARTGRPHFLIVDEAHHLMPAHWQPANLPVRSHGQLYITVRPHTIAPVVTATIETVIALGEHPEEALAELAAATQREAPRQAAIEKLASGRALYWKIGAEPIEIATVPPTVERVRHSKKYVEGNLADRSFCFRGPENKLRIRAHNLMQFLELADGVDEDTWTFHLRAGDYSSWVRAQVKDDELADAFAAIERDRALSPDESRARIRAAVEKRYTLPADQPSGASA